MPPKPSAQTLALNADIIANVMLMRREFLQHLIDPRRDIDKECGYPVNPTIRDFKTMYDREGIGTRVVDIYPEDCWQIDPEIVETPDGSFTDWELAFQEIVTKHNLFNLLITADKISGIGSYGIILFGIDDGKPLTEPVEGVDLKTGERIGENTKATRKLLYVRAFDESVLTITGYESDKTSPRFGRPLGYTINLAQDTTGSQASSASTSSPESQTLTVHWTRVVHLAEGRTNSIVFGVSRMFSVFNRLCDLRKVLGGSGEMFWKGGFPGIAFQSMPNTTGAELTGPEKLALRGEFEAYQNGLQRYLALVGMEAKSLSVEVADPTAHFETEVKAICTSKGIPYRIFMGTEEAQLAGDQDRKSWNSRLARRQNRYINPEVIRPVVDLLIALSVIDKPKTYTVTWVDLNTPGDQQKAEVGSKRTEAMAKYVAGQVDALVAPLEYLTHVLGYSTEIAEAMLQSALLKTDGTLDREEMVPPTPPPAANPGKPAAKKPVR